ncbi:MAG: sigma-70 family RNA polymerase sigma factor [Candidatus Promineifilaceae bacterium]|nr:sigma-70 family RNA polymerase sigma factor [Candidatus Promineifilaceae bacterium]
MSVHDERSLLAGVQRLDPEALNQTHETYYPVIYRYIVMKVGNHHAAEDLTSEVFVRLLSAVRDQRAPQNTLRGWLFRVASIVVADYHRQRYRDRDVDWRSVDERSYMDPRQQTAKKEQVEALHEALTELTDNQQEVIALRFGAGMAIRDVAMTMNKSEGAVKMLQARAVAALSEQLAAWRSRA